MIPIKLTIEGFLTFKDRVVIDFTRIYEDGLFLISGPTGSGKTSIFDAMVYALYGSASTKERNDSKELRSQLITEDDNLFVEFIFSVDGVEYVARRYKYGKKLEKQQFCQTGAEEQALTKVGEILKEVEYITGLTLSQFKKIVLLPQGEFRNFLMAGTMEKSQILRSLFDTRKYDKIKEIVKVRLDRVQKLNNEAYETIQREKIVSERAETAVIPEEVEKILQADLHALTLEYQNILKELELSENKLKLLEKTLQATEQDNKTIEVFQSAQREYDDQLERQGDYAARKALADQLNQIRPLIIKQAALLEDETDLAALIDTRNHTGVKAGEAEQALEKARGDFELNMTRSEAIKALNLKISEQEKLLGSLRTLAERQSELEGLRREFTALKEEEVKRLEKDKLYLQLNEEINVLAEGINQALAQKGELSSEWMNLENRIIKMKGLLDEQADLQHLAEDIGRLQNSRLVKQTEKDRIEKELQIKTERFDLSGLNKYTEKLTEGEPCPLCGSTHHPRIFKSDGETVSVKELNALRMEGKRISDEFSKITSSIEVKLEQQGIRTLKFHEKLPDGPGSLPSQAELAEMTAKALVLQVEIKAAEAALKERSDKKRTAEEQKAEAETFIKRHKDLPDQLAAKRDEVTALTASVADLETVTGSLDAAAVKQAMAETKSELGKLTRAVKTAEEAYRKVSADCQMLQSDLTSLSARITGQEDRIAGKRQALQAGLQEAGLTETAFTSLIAHSHEEASLRQEAEEYFKHLQDLLTTLKIREGAASGKVYVDTAGFIEQIKAQTNRSGELANRRDGVRDGLTELKSALKRISQARVVYENTSEEVSIARLFYDMTSRGVSFENFVLSYYLDGVLLNANTRLAQMTTGRYRLIRKTEGKVDRRSSQGLELNVYDAYSNTERDVRTLSGGESFKASLALALGLSDFLLENRKGIRMDSIFIDEGFGTLDQESLYAALEMIMDLNQRGRIVGIISHVEELKGMISSKFLVENFGAKGSKVRYVNQLMGS